MRYDRSISISKSDRTYLINLAKDLCVATDEVISFVKNAKSYSQAHTKILNVYEDAYMRSRRSIIKRNSRGGKLGFIAA